MWLYCSNICGHWSYSLMQWYWYLNLNCCKWQLVLYCYGNLVIVYRGTCLISLLVTAQINAITISLCVHELQGTTLSHSNTGSYNQFMRQSLIPLDVHVHLHWHLLLSDQASKYHHSYVLTYNSSILKFVGTGIGNWYLNHFSASSTIMVDLSFVSATNLVYLQYSSINLRGVSSPLVHEAEAQRRISISSVVELGRSLVNHGGVLKWQHVLEALQPWPFQREL